MKKIKKVLLISLLFLVSATGIASAQLSIQAGYAYALSNGNLELGDFKEYTGRFRNNGFQAGLNYDFTIKNDLGLQVGVLYSFFRGTTIENERTINDITGNLRTNSSYQFIDIPLRVTYDLPVTNEFKITIFAGPNFTYALSGWSEGTIYGNQLIIMPKYENVYQTFENDLNRFDLKAGGGIGVQYGLVGIKIGYDFGILNSYNGLIKSKENGNKYKMRRGQFGISFFFNFWK